MQKMTLIPYDAVLTQAAGNPYFRQTLDSHEPAVRKIKILQAEMDQLLTDPNLSDRDKAIFLTQMEGQLASHLKRYRESLVTHPVSLSLSSGSASVTQQPTVSTPTIPSSPGIVPPPAAPVQPPGAQAIKPENKAIVLSSIPRPYKKKAEQVIDVLSTHPQFSVNSKNEISVGERSIPGSNLIDLLLHTTTPKKSIDNLEGLDSFSKILRDSNIPRSYLSRQAQAQVYTNEPPLTSPPRLSPQTGRKWEPWT
jgi:hypothetical protein